MNAGTREQGWKVVGFSEYSTSATSFLSAGDVVRLYQKEERCWLSVEKELLRVHDHSPGRGEDRVRVKRGVRAVIGKGSESRTSASTSTLWQVEREVRVVGGSIHFGERVRLRHFGSRMYLSTLGMLLSSSVACADFPSKGLLWRCREMTHTNSSGLCTWKIGWSSPKTADSRNRCGRSKVSLI